MRGLSSLNNSVAGSARMVACTVAVGSMLAGGVALADGDDENPLTWASATVTGSTQSAATDRLPRGWFTGKFGYFSGAKTNLQTTVSVGATACSAASAGALATYNSQSGDGTTTAAKNPAGKTNGWFYSITADLSAAITGYTNHWHRNVDCSGKVTIIGCAQATPVNTTITAYDKRGACYTYTAADGSEACASDTTSYAIAAIHDADTADQCGGGAAGKCVKECQAACKSSLAACKGSTCPTKLDNCHKACSSSCK